MKVKAIGHRVVVKPLNLEALDPVLAGARKAGIWTSEVTERQLQTGVDRGTVLEIGPTAFIALNPADYNTPWCKVGDTIAYARNAGKQIRVGEEVGDIVLVINDEDVVTVLED